MELFCFLPEIFSLFCLHDLLHLMAFCKVLFQTPPLPTRACICIICFLHSVCSNIWCTIVPPYLWLHFCGSLRSIRHHKDGECSRIRYFQRERDHIHITFITIYCYTCCILLVIFNLLVCLIYKLNLVIGIST